MTDPSFTVKVFCDNCNQECLNVTHSMNYSSYRCPACKEELNLE